MIDAASSIDLHRWWWAGGGSSSSLQVDAASGSPPPPPPPRARTAACRHRRTWTTDRTSFSFVIRSDPAGSPSLAATAFCLLARVSQDVSLVVDIRGPRRLHSHLLPTYVRRPGVRRSVVWEYIWCSQWAGGCTLNRRTWTNYEWVKD